MSERGHFRGGGRGQGGRGGRGGGGGGRGGNQGAQAEKPKKENILDLTKYMDKQVNVKFNGGRESKCSLHMASAATDLVSVIGTLKGYDQLMNLVLDDVKETMRGELQSSVSCSAVPSDILQMTKGMRLPDHWDSSLLEVLSWSSYLLSMAARK